MDAWRRQRDLDLVKVHRGPLPDGLQGPHVADDEFTGNADYWRAVEAERREREFEADIEHRS
jgi:hypothetical protein